MIYVFDTNSFRVISHYYPERFPSFWKRLDELISQDRILSVREVLNELDGMPVRIHMQKWIGAHKSMFLPATEEESMFVKEIFSVTHFRQLVAQKQMLRGTPVADPFVIASAKARQGCVVTEEERKPNSAKIPNVCEYFEIDCVNVEGFMEREDWSF